MLCVEMASSRAMLYAMSMNIVQQLLPRELKEAATAAFRDNAKLVQMTPQEREATAQAYEQIALLTTGEHAGLATLYNLERARFLRGEVAHIAPTARAFAQEKGIDDAE